MVTIAFSDFYLLSSKGGTYGLNKFFLDDFAFYFFIDFTDLILLTFTLTFN